MGYDTCNCGGRKANHAQMCSQCRGKLNDRFVPKNITPEQIAWVAGIIEGEGCISSTKKKPQRWWISVRMTDKDTIQRLHMYTGIGSRCSDASKYYTGMKPCYCWQVCKRVHREWLAKLIYPWLGERRQKRLYGFYAGVV